MPKATLIFLFALLANSPTFAAEPNRGIDGIQAAVERLVKRADPGAFLIVTETSTGKFVQISRDPKTGMALDLPVDGLTEEEQKRASLHLIQLGAEFLSWQVEEHQMQAYVKQLNHDTEEAVRFIEIVLKDVYRFGPDANYTFTEY